MSTLKTTNLQHASAASAAIVLASDSTATLNGLAYPTSGSLSGRNRIINGDMRIDARNAGASVTQTTTDTYSVDRWVIGGSPTSKFTAQRSTTAPGGFANSLLITSSSAYSVGAGDFFYFMQGIEGFNAADLDFGKSSAKTVTLSFWVRSSLTGTFGGALRNKISGADRSYPFTYSISAANTWEQKTITVTGDTTGTWTTDNSCSLTVCFGLGVGSTYSGTAGAWAGANYVSATGATSVVGTNGATFYLTGCQLEQGSVATPFERRSYGQELALCQRYYYKFPAVYHQVFKNGFYESSVLYFPVTMRAAPSMTSSGSWVLRALNGGTDTAYSGFTYNVSPEGFYLSSTTTNNSNFYSWISGTLIASAEL